MENHKHFLKLLDFTPEEITRFLDTAAELKAKKKAGIPHRYLEGKNVALIFEKTSTRTRCSFEVAAHDLGMQVTYLDPDGSQIGKKESIADTARVLGRMFDGIEYRGYGQEIVEELAEYVDLNPSYLSRLFKKEVGTSISEYIRRQKLETAKNMLVYSEYRPAEIATTLAFPSQSYFTEIFHKYTGLTPKEYRKQYFQITLSEEDKATS